jgi:hypothetical protein
MRGWGQNQVGLILGAQVNTLSVNTGDKSPLDNAAVFVPI